VEGSGLEGQTLPLHPCGQLTRCYSAVAELLVHASDNRLLIYDVYDVVNEFLLQHRCRLNDIILLSSSRCNPFMSNFTPKDSANYHTLVVLSTEKRLAVQQTAGSHSPPLFACIMFLPRDATQSAVMPQYDVCPSVCLSVCLSVCDVQVCFTHRLKYIENNFTAE